ncbi:hypothetical protein B0T19DRAFT_444270 [Cercophora scortea]|uniref:P-loop containing nucleoside triphosphate hydrolase protein n=1 Tax=Cercophora scortea TaxID=314031 RepID=A0AAE0M6K5_9PEZI|nr:hypothetical protein B0T19DRAFT_444270 [Cercophora scortea]
MLLGNPLTSPLYNLLERLYALPASPKPTRTTSLSLLCVGLPRTGTESLQRALLHLGYTHTHHGWDIVYPSPAFPHATSPGWVSLARRKALSQPLNAADFDAVLGHCAAVTDAAGSVFAADLIRAYPDAKVVLNMRRDEAAWRKSVQGTLVRAHESWAFWLASWLDRECFWAWHVYERFLWPMLFGVGVGGDLGVAVRGRAGDVYNEHSNMIRGLVPKDRLLEWYVEDGWEPLCKFLGKPVPNMPFPHENTATGGWKARERQCNERWVNGAFVNLILLFVGVLVAAAVWVVYLR